MNEAIRTASALVDLWGAGETSPGTWTFRTWAPSAHSAAVRIFSPEAPAAPRDVHPLRDLGGGVFAGEVSGLAAGLRYDFLLDGVRPTADPAAAWLPDGPYGAAALVSPSAFPWSEAPWQGRPLEGNAFYHLHAGAATASGTLDDAASLLPEIAGLGVDALLLAPVCTLWGGPGWGDLPLFPWSVSAALGGPDALRRFVDSAHRLQLAVALEIPLGGLAAPAAALEGWAPFLRPLATVPAATAGPSASGGTPISAETLSSAPPMIPWNLDAAGDALSTFWRGGLQRMIADYRLDGVRPWSGSPLVGETASLPHGALAQAVAAAGKGLGRSVWYLGATGESVPAYAASGHAGRNGREPHAAATAAEPPAFQPILASLLLPPKGGEGMEIDEEALPRLGEILQSGDARGEQAAPRPALLAGQNFAWFARSPEGRRWTHELSFEARKLAAATVLLAPQTPVVFMGEEYGETQPFPYFAVRTDAGAGPLDAAFADAVERARRRAAGLEAGVEPPSATSNETFRRAVLSPEDGWNDEQRTLRAFYRCLLRHRRGETPALKSPATLPPSVEALPDGRTLSIFRDHAREPALVLLHFSDAAAEVEVPAPAGEWRRVLDSADLGWRGPLDPSFTPLVSNGSLVVPMAPFSVVVLAKRNS